MIIAQFINKSKKCFLEIHKNFVRSLRVILGLILYALPVQLFCSHEQPQRHVLFIMDKLQMGGSEQAFVSLINSWEIPQTKVEIFLKARGGVLEPFLRKDFPIISAKEAFSCTYDVAVAYVEWLNPKSNLRKAHAKRKVQWIHTDLLEKPQDRPFKHKELCEGIDAFICVSEGAAESAKKIQPQLSRKIFSIHNVLDGDMVREKAKKEKDCFPQDGILNVVSVGRLAPEKALERAIRVHNRLDKEGICFRWYVVGEGRDRSILEEQIKQLGMEGKFILLGGKLNPYPYITQADIFALPSFFEGFSTVINEAKLLARPILMTEVSGAREQIESEKNGLIVANDEEAIYYGMKRLLQDSSLRKEFSDTLQGFVYDNGPIYAQIEKVLLERPEFDPRFYTQTR
jgi:glycosyltransferase involved in cell wall biosynthesis